MRWHDGNARGPGWFSHQLADGSYCKGKSLLLDSGVLCSTMVREAHLLIEGH